MDNKILEKRLMYRESSIGLVASVNKCAKSFSEFMTKPIDNRSISQESFIRDIMAYKFDMKKVIGMVDMCDEEIKEYEIEGVHLQKEHMDIQQNIINLHVELEHEQLLRAVKVECNAQAAKVNALPTQTTLKRQIDDAEVNLFTTISAINEEEVKISKRLKILEQIQDLVDELKTRLPAEENPQVGAVADESEDDERDSREDERVAPQTANDTVADDDVQEEEDVGEGEEEEGLIVEELEEQDDTVME